MANWIGFRTGQPWPVSNTPNIPAMYSSACCLLHSYDTAFFHLPCNVTQNLSLGKYSRSARNAILSFHLVCNGSTYRLIGLSQGQ